MSNLKGITSFEDIFKSTPHAECSNCGADITEDISKAMKGGKTGGSNAAKKLGNEMDPHKGGKTGSQVKHPRGGKKSPIVDRDATGHKVGTVVMGKSETPPPFPNAPPFRASEWTGTDADAMLASQMEAAQRGEPNDLHIPSQRNPHLERDAELSRVEE